MVRTLFDEMLESSPRPQKRSRTLTEEELLSLRKESLLSPKKRHITRASKPPRGRKRNRDAAEMYDSSARKRRAPKQSSPVGSPIAAPSLKRRKVDDLDADVDMPDAAQSPGLSTPMSGSARKSSRRKKLAKDVLRDNRRRGAVPSANTPQHCRHSTDIPRPTPCASASTHYSCQQPQSYTSSTDHRHDAQSSYFNDSSRNTFQVDGQSAWVKSDRPNTHSGPTANHSSNSPASDYYSDEVFELDVSTGAYDEKPAEIPDSNANASDTPTLQYLFSSENQLLLNIRYGTSRKVGVVVDIPPF